MDDPVFIAVLAGLVLAMILVSLRPRVHRLDDGDPPLDEDDRQWRR
jgi:hypothetical protein